MQFALFFTFILFSFAYTDYDYDYDYEDDNTTDSQGGLKCNNSDLAFNLEDGGSCYFYDLNRGSFLKAKKKDLFCKEGFCMKKEKIIRAKNGSKIIYRKVQNRLVISQCAPSLGVKVSNTFSALT